MISIRGHGRFDNALLLLKSEIINITRFYIISYFHSWYHDADNNNELLVTTLQKYSDVIGPECTDKTSINCELAILHKNT